MSGLADELEALIAAFHEAMPQGQGETGDGGLAGKVLCQFVYDRSDDIAEALEMVANVGGGVFGGADRQGSSPVAACRGYGPESCLDQVDLFQTYSLPDFVHRFAAAAIQSLAARLEMVPGWSQDTDGIACRDATIVSLDGRLAAERAKVAELVIMLTDCAADIEGVVEAKRGSVLARTTDRDLIIVRQARALIERMK